MLIEKNICDNLLWTILNVEGKTKDTLKARCDIAPNGPLDVLKHLQMTPQDGGETYEMPDAPYALSKECARTFCQFLRDLKFLDGYDSNFADRKSVV